MKRTNFTEEQVIGVRKEAETGAKTVDLTGRLGMTIFNWKLKCGRIEASEAQRWFG